MSEREAVEARPWRSVELDGPPPAGTLYPPGEQRQLSIRTRGAWPATVVMRLDWADGRRSYQVEITRPGADGVRGTYELSFWWDPETVRSALPVDGFGTTRAARG